MKVTLEFTLPEEQEECKIHQQAMGMFVVIGDLDRDLRNQLKYDDTMSDEKRITLERVRDRLYKHCQDHGVEI